MEEAPQVHGLGSGASAPSGISFAGHLHQIQDLIDAVQGARPVLIGGREGLKAVALVNALYKSGRSGQPVGVEPGPAAPVRQSPSF